MIVVAGLLHHPSFKNVATDIMDVARQRGVECVWGPTYLEGRDRNMGLRPVVIGSMIDSRMHFYLAYFSSYPTLRLAYLTAEGPLDTSWWRKNLFSGYKVVANSMWTEKWLTEAGIKVDAVVHHAYNPHFVSKARNNPYRPPQTDNHTVWLSYIGQVGPRKRVEQALEALRISQKKTGYGIGLITNAPIDPYLLPDDKKILRVGSFGSLSREDALALIAGSQYYLHLSRSEGFGMPALEARALNVPLIALAMQPTVEFIPSKAALWVPVNGATIVDGYGPMAFVEHTYSVEEAADIIVQAHDIYTRHEDIYQDMVAACREDLSRYRHTKLYGRLLDLVGVGHAPIR